MSCFLTASPTLKDLDEYIACLSTARKIEYVSTWKPLVDIYFEKEDVNKALLIIYCESRGKPWAVGKNKNGTYDIGLWQFNDMTWAWLSEKLKIISPRTNPRVSTAVASWLVYNDGWYHWNSSKHCWGNG
jgi:hypothetical protein